MANIYRYVIIVRLRIKQILDDSVFQGILCPDSCEINFNLNVLGFSLNNSMQEGQIQVFLFRCIGTRPVNSKGTFTSLHQQGFSLWAIHSFCALQKGQILSLI
jgi:hypothetical protein